ncbi:MAG: glycosyltransferase family 39 protein [Acidobacteriota bacterium]|nr:glycosyltransferase family 39 protein [Acidobacteriota bacterium]
MVVQSNGWTLFYGDAEAHLDIARRIVDSRTPGYDQVGTVWLPLPHALMLPLVVDQRLWQTGLAGAIASAVCFILSGAFLFGAARRIFGSLAAALVTTGVFATNPNLLYLQSTPMTEGVFYLGLLALLYAMSVFHDKHSWMAVAGAGIASAAASLTRYEGWFLIPFATIFFMVTAERQQWKIGLAFGLIASLAPLYWLAHNFWYFGDPLSFYNGPYSAQAIYQRALDQGMARYAGDHDWAKALLYYGSASGLCIGWGSTLTAACGVAAVVRKRIWWPAAFLGSLPVFYVWSMHSSGTPIFVPHLWPNGYYNTRYGLSALPLIALCAGAVVLLPPAKYRLGTALAALVLALCPWVIHANQENLICWKESQVNSEGRRAWTWQAAQYLTAHRRTGAGIFSQLGDLAGIYREAGIPLREVLHEGNGAAWDAAIARPDLFLHEPWAVAQAGDKVAAAILKAARTGPHYECVQTIIVKDAPVIEIYRRTENGT